MPVRKISTSQSAITGLVPSTKTNGMRAFESSLERDLITCIEFDNQVFSYEEQPLRIDFADATGKRRSYTPDVLISYRQDITPAKWLKPRLCEVKYRLDLWQNWPELRPKFQAAVRYASGHGMEFKILTEKEIRTEYWQNARFLLRYKDVTVEPAYVSKLYDIVHDQRETSPEAIVLCAASNVWKRAEYLYVLWHMVANRTVGTDLSSKLTMQSPIWANDLYVSDFTKPFSRR